MLFYIKFLSPIRPTYDVKHYFSYQKEQGCSGRFMNMIGLKTI